MGSAIRGSMIGQTIGQYRIEGVLGEGGIVVETDGTRRLVLLCPINKQYSRQKHIL